MSEDEVVASDVPRGTCFFKDRINSIIRLFSDPRFHEELFFEK